MNEKKQLIFVAEKLLMDEKPVCQCIWPFRETRIKLTIREYTPVPNGLEFVPGETLFKNKFIGILLL